MIWEIRRRFLLWGLVRRIRRRGWTGIFVHNYEDGMVPFAYSMGFWEALGAPEVIMFGMPDHVAIQLLERIYGALKIKALALVDKATWTLSEGDESWTLAWRAVHPSQIRKKHLTLAIWYRMRQRVGPCDLEAFQLFAPDKAGKFPWEEGHDADYRPRQPELYLPYFGPADED